MNDFCLKKCSEIVKLSEYQESIVLLKRTIKLKTNLSKKGIRFMGPDGKMDYLFLQSGNIPILYGISEYCGIKFIDFPSCSSDLLTSMEKVQNLIINNYVDIFNGLIFTNNIQRNSIRFRYTEETRVFFKEKLFYGKLSKNSIVKIIVCPREIWITGEKFGFNWDIIQIMLIEPSDIKIEQNLFNPETIANDNDTVYSKYIKMYKRGVPEGAVRNKMELDGLDRNFDFINCKSNNNPGSNTKSMIPPPPPAPNMLGIFAEIKSIGNSNGGFPNLKKTTINKKSDKESKKGMRVGLGKINLKDILNMKKRLNKTGSKIISPSK